MKTRKILFAGPSGIGKTTEANYVKDILDIEFISGSVSDLIPNTKNMTHQYMLGRDHRDLYYEDYSILNLRNKLFGRAKGSFVSDRSYLDLAAYFLYKQAKYLATCDVEQFVELCKKFTLKNCTHLIFLRLKPELIKIWSTENNNKRIVNNYFQSMISNIMDLVLELWNVNYIKKLYNPYMTKVIGDIFKIEDTKILCLNTTDLKTRNEIIERFVYDQEV